MAHIPEYKSIYRFILESLEREAVTRRELVEKTIAALCPEKTDIKSNELVGAYTRLRSSVGIVVNEMVKKGVIELTDGAKYVKKTDKSIAIRIEECEEEILKLVSEAPRSKSEIRERLVDFFGTDTTSSAKDDNQLLTYIGQILKSLLGDGSFTVKDGIYSVAPQKSADIKSKAEMLDLKAAFLTRVHSHGGEFFEYYFLELTKRYLLRFGKTIIEGYVTGGSDDGGIDGVIRTKDSLGFIETIMIQTKNRTDTVNETDVRGFLGAVYAKRGSRGIFATISNFHPMAIQLINSVDELVGIDGAKIFSMACDTSYGIKRDGNKFIIDDEII